jgi:transposase
MKLHDADPGKLLGDKGYDSDEIRDDLAKRGIEPVIPPRSNRNEQINYDRSAYKRRNLIERCVNRLKQFRRIATRYEKTARAYLSMLCIAATKLWIKPSTRPSATSKVYKNRIIARLKAASDGSDPNCLGARGLREKDFALANPQTSR